MHLLIRHSVENELVLPINYNHIIQAIIYSALNDSGEYSKKLHDASFSLTPRQFKFFTFSQIKGNYNIQEKRIIFNRNVSIEISSLDIYLIKLLMEHFHNDGIRYGNNFYKNVEVYLSDASVESDEIQIKMISPLTIYRTKDKNGFVDYISPEQDEFSALINANFKRKYKSCNGIPVDSEIEICPYKVKPNDKQVIKFKNTYITAWSGEYILRGPRKYLDFLYQTGIGSKNSAGFGMFDIIE